MLILKRTPFNIQHYKSKRIRRTVTSYCMDNAPKLQLVQKWKVNGNRNINVKSSVPGSVEETEDKLR
jgi:hypothetical protein